MQHGKFFNRDISWLYFNAQVLSQAENKGVPLLERINFLSIYSSNLDEFYRVRIPAIRALQKINKEDDSVYREVTAIINKQQSHFGDILTTQIVPALREQGFQFLYNKPIPDSLLPVVVDYFFTHVAGLLQVVALEGKVDFFPENNQLYLAVVANDKDEEKLFLVNIPCNAIARFFTIKNPERTYILFLEDIIRQCLHYIFTSMQVKGAYNIKITRDAELELLDEYSEDMADKIEKQLSKRDHGFATRFLYEPGIPLRHLYHISDAFNLQNAAVMEGGRHHNLRDLASLPINDASLRYEPWPSRPALVIDSDTSLFTEMQAGDIIVHTPYQSYDTIIRFFNESAIDETVEEIYTTLYRIASDSKIAQALISAAKNGKKVVVLVELKARFDEANNIRWAKKMKDAGVKIVYSNKALKVHAKVALVKRKHASHTYLGLLATGNLNESTARFYTDHILLTAHQGMLEEVKTLFAFLGKHKMPDSEDDMIFKHLLVPPFNLQARFLALIQREMDHAKNNLPASIIIKMNNLEEEVLINKLYEASNAGVRIQLIVRSICRLVPNVQGQSENITVKRIVDRYLEHGRVFVFHNNGHEEMYMGSADWMNRNIYHRIEVCFPIYNEIIRQQLRHIISLELEDNVQAVYIGNDLEPVKSVDDELPLRSQEAIYQYLSGRAGEV